MAQTYKGFTISNGLRIWQTVDGATIKTDSKTGAVGLDDNAINRAIAALTAIRDARRYQQDVDNGNPEPRLPGEP